MIDNPPPLDLWAEAFAITCAVEVPLYWLLLRRLVHHRGHRLGHATTLLLALAVNVTTHPALWYLMPRFEPYALWVVFAESCVVLVESTLIALALARAPDPPLAPGRAAGLGLLMALGVNAVSTGVGFVLQALGWGR